MGKYVERGSKPPHAIAADDPPAVVLIKEEHQMFRALFDRAEIIDEGPFLVSLTSEICLRLAIHMTLEEEILYPALRLAIGHGKVDEGVVEHELAKALIVDLVHMTGREALYRAKVRVLGGEVMHHIDEEDEGLLADARAAWEAGKIDLPLLYLKLNERRLEMQDIISTMARAREPEIQPVGDAIEEYEGTGFPPGGADAAATLHIKVDSADR